MTTKTAYKTPSHFYPPSTAMNPSKTNFTLLIQALLMALLISLFCFFLGITALILIHFCITGRALRWDSAARNDLHHSRFLQASSLTGLTSKDLQKLPSFSYDNAGIGTASAGACPICLEGFKDGEVCRVLPACRHVFHVQCVDRWLARVSACPVCRAWVVGLKIDVGGIGV